jgi:hypothetical protein
VVIALGRWGSTAPLPPRGIEIGVDSTVLGLRTLFDPAAADGFEATVELRLREHTFGAQVADGSFDVVRGAAEEPDAVLTATPGTLAALLWQGRTLAQAERSDGAAVDGDRRLLERFLRLFPLPR